MEGAMVRVAKFRGERLPFEDDESVGQRQPLYLVCSQVGCSGDARSQVSGRWVCSNHREGGKDGTASMCGREAVDPST